MFKQLGSYWVTYVARSFDGQATYVTVAVTAFSRSEAIESGKSMAREASCGGDPYHHADGVIDRSRLAELIYCHKHDDQVFDIVPHGVLGSVHAPHDRDAPELPHINMHNLRGWCAAGQHWVTLSYSPEAEQAFKGALIQTAN